MSERFDYPTAHKNGGPLGGWTPHDDLPAFALGLLEGDEGAQFEAHLATCDVCQVELAAQQPLGELLARGLPPQQPPSGAFERLLARARTEDAPNQEPTIGATGPTPVIVTALPPDAPLQIEEPPSGPPRAALDPIPYTRVPTRPRQRRIRLASLGWAAALLFVIASGLFVGAWAATGPHASAAVELQARLPGGQVLPLAGTGVPTARARLFVVQNGRQAELAVDALPPLRAGRVYQLWFAEPDQPIKTGGAFSVDARGDAVARVTIPAPLERMRAIAVTEEPAPGSPGPTGPHLLDWAP